MNCIDASIAHVAGIAHGQRDDATCLYCFCTIVIVEVLLALFNSKVAAFGAASVDAM